MKRFVIATILLVAGASIATAQMNGDLLHQGWLSYQMTLEGLTKDAPAAIFAAGVFSGYVLAISDTYAHIPVGTPNTQIMRVVGAFLDSHPNIQNERGSKVILEALQEAYPPPPPVSKQDKSKE